MAWWFAAPVVVYAAKKLYDAVTEDDAPPARKGPTRFERSLKERSKVRRQAIKRVLTNRRERLVNQIRRRIAKDTSLAKAKITINDSKLQVSFTEIDNALAALYKAKHALELSPQPRETEEPSSFVIELSPTKNTVEKSLKNARSSYGEYCGIDKNDYYTESQDQFLAALKKL